MTTLGDQDPLFCSLLILLLAAAAAAAAAAIVVVVSVSVGGDGYLLIQFTGRKMEGPVVFVGLTDTENGRTKRCRRNTRNVKVRRDARKLVVVVDHGQE